MYQRQNQHAWMNAGTIRSMKVTGKAVMLCSYGININVMANLMLVQCVIASHTEVWTCQFWWKFYQELSVTMVQVPEKNGSVNSRSTLCPIEIRSCLPKTLLQALIWLFTFCKLSNFFLLDLASIKTLLACSILWGM